MTRKSISAEFLETLKSRIDIVDVASKYMTITKKGSNYWACCPFHSEKTPSFSIKQDGQFFKCFGCGESGDVINLVSKLENVDFVTSVEILAKMAGLEIPSDTDNEKAKEQKRQRDMMFHVLSLTADFYHKNLLDNPDSDQAKYLKKREINSDMVEKFNIGVSLNFNDLPNFLRKMGVKDADMLQAGVVGKNDYGKLYDFYANRLIFPIFNGFGDVVAFSGRSVTENPQHAKYKNTPQSPIFNKSEILFGYNFVRKLKNEKMLDTIILVEGHLDVISCHQFGLTNTIGSMGTAITTLHAKRIKQLVQDVILCLDGDSAGNNATYKAINTLKDEGLNVKVVRLQGAKDPDEFLKKYGKEEFVAMLTNAIDCVDFILHDSAKNFNLDSNSDKNKYINLAIDYISKFSTPAEQAIYLGEVQRLTRVPIDALRKSLQSSNVEQKTTEETPAEMVSNNYIQESKIMILASILYKKIKDVKDIASLFEGEDELSELYQFMTARIAENKDFNASTLFDNFDINKTSLIDKVINYVFPADEVYDQYLKDTIKRVKLFELQEEKDKYTKLMNSSMTDADRYTYLKKVQELTQKINKEKG